MKRITSTLLLLLFLFNVVGFYSLYLLLNTNNRAHIQNMAKNPSHLVTLRIPVSEIKNINFKEAGEEFEYNGEMFDVVSSSKEGDYMVFHCFNDKTEKQLREGLDTHVKNNSDSNAPEKKPSSSSKKPFKDLFCLNDNTKVEESTAVVYPSPIVHLPFAISSTLPLPPPEVSIA